MRKRDKWCSATVAMRLLNCKESVLRELVKRHDIALNNGSHHGMVVTLFDRAAILQLLEHGHVQPQLPQMGVTTGRTQAAVPNASAPFHWQCARPHCPGHDTYFPPALYDREAAFGNCTTAQQPQPAVLPEKAAQLTVFAIKRASTGYFIPIYVGPPMEQKDYENFAAAYTDQRLEAGDKFVVLRVESAFEEVRKYSPCRLVEE